MGLMDGIGNTTIGALLGMGMANANDKRQVRQNKKLMKQQIAGQKEMGQFNQQLAMEMWRKTNYSAQMEEMKKAGLNPGLMYGSAGSGGTTQTPTGNVSTGTAPVGGGEYGMGMQLALQKRMTEAQIEATEAQTEKTKVETAKTAGIDTAEATSRIAKMAQDTANAAIQGTLLNLQTKYQEIENNIQNETQEFLIQQIQGEAEQAVAEADKATTEANVSKETKQSQIQQIRAAAVEQAAKVGLIKEQILTQQQITKEKAAAITKITEEIIRMKAQTSQGERGLNQEDQRIILDQMRTEFGSGDEARAIRWINTVGDAAGNIMKGKPKTTKTRTDKGEDWSETTTTHK